MKPSAHLVLKREVELVARGELDELRDLIRDWLAVMKDRTMRTYRADLDDFARWAHADSAEAALAALFRQPNPRANAIVLAYRTDMLKRPVFRTIHARRAGHAPARFGLAPATVNRRLVALRSVSRVARLTGAFDGRIEVKGLPVESYRDTSGIGNDAYRKIIGALEEVAAEPGNVGVIGCRDLTIVRLLHDGGLRRQETVSLDLAHVDLERKKLLLVKPKHRRHDVTIDLGAHLVRVLARWIAVRGDEPGPLFPSRKTGRMHVSAVNRRIRAAGDRIGIHVAPHALRHTAITTALDRGADIRLVSRFARHGDIRVTHKYDDRRRDPTPEIQDLIGDDDD